MLLEKLGTADEVGIRRVNTDYDPDTAARYGVYSTPTTLVIDADGIIGFASCGVINMRRLTQQLEKLR